MEDLRGRRAGEVAKPSGSAKLPVPAIKIAAAKTEEDAHPIHLTEFIKGAIPIVCTLTEDTHDTRTAPKQDQGEDNDSEDAKK